MRYAILALWLCLIPAGVASPAVASLAPRSAEYEAVQQRLARGWNTWDVRSVTAHVLLPEGLAIRVGLKHNGALNGDAYLADALIGRFGRHGETEEVFPGLHTVNGSYTDVKVVWRGHTFRVETAHAGEDWVALITPVAPGSGLPPTLVVSAGVLWNRGGAVQRADDSLVFEHGPKRVPVFWTATAERVADLPVATPYLSTTFTEVVGVATGQRRSIAEIRAALDRARPHDRGIDAAIETVIGWDTIYEPTQARVISPVSRLWSISWGGYVLFEWDTYFAAALAAPSSRDLAYANALEMGREITPAGFLPNYARTDGWKSFDRSEPPVGAITVLQLFRRFGDAWFIRDTFPALLAWNRWWAEHRDHDGYLVWGTDAKNRPANPDDPSPGTKQGAAYESGLDNSPMFDDAPFDAASGQLRQADAGLMGLYVADCDALAEIATALGRAPEAGELRARGDRYRQRLRSLWDERSGLFLNRNLVTGEFSPRLSPTLFYPLLARAATPQQAERMVRDHLLNPAEFWGEWVLPTIARSDPAFKDQAYWRGRIWGPMNYLVYLGLREYDLATPRQQLAARSRALFEREWRQFGHVHENYNAVTGDGDDVDTSDRFYHWGALLALIDVLEREPGDPRLFRAELPGTR